MALLPAIYQTSSDQALFVLLTIQPADGSTPLRVVNNLEPITSRGKVFEAYPFAIDLPPDADDLPPQVRITIDAVDQRVIEIIRGLADPPEVTLELVLSGSPDIVDKAISALQLSDVQYDALTVSGTLTVIDYLAQVAVDGVYSGVEFPDLVIR